MTKVYIAIANFSRNLANLLDAKIKSLKPSQSTLISLAPKVLDDNEIGKIVPYLNYLKQALDTEGVNNIAITGSYGSGKSTILKTFQDRHDEYKYLNISLASFKDNSEKKDDEGFERKLEISILQQMFYHVRPSVIPDSRFKRIINVSRWDVFLQISLLILWGFSASLLFKFDKVNKLNPDKWSFKYTPDLWAIFAIVMFVMGLSFFFKNIFRVLRNSKINKFTIKGELELGEGIDKSVFNQHLEELLYFFERTDFNVVCIEDVDRFDSTDIFTKLREINILLNNSNLIKREVKFVYAIKDEMFTDKNERVKFFEFIIPVIPFINPNNASEQLTKLITDTNMEGVLSSDFTSDVVTFIDDIDMRLLINIFQEYQLYKASLNDSLTQDKLFAIIVYKNMFPKDFGELAKRKGDLYQFLSNRNEYAAVLTKDIEKRIKLSEEEIGRIENEPEKPISELRAVYIIAIVSKLEKFACFYNEANQVTTLQALEDDNFKVIKKASKIAYARYEPNYNYNNRVSISSSVESNVNFSTIEKEIDSNSYDYREKQLLNRYAKRTEKLKLEIEKDKRKITEIESLSMGQPSLERFRSSQQLCLPILGNFLGRLIVLLVQAHTLQVIPRLAHLFQPRKLIAQSHYRFHRSY